MRIYAKSLAGLAVDAHRAAILAASLVTDALLGARCRYECNSRFHDDMKRKLHEYANHCGDRRRP